jgi:uncharacterized membrane protein YcaP (DUF421 family)
MGWALALGELLFGHRDAHAWWQECDRAALVFLYGLALVRIAGRRMFGKWAALDIIVSVMVGSNLSRVITGNAALLGTLAATTAMMAMHWVLAHAAARSAWFSALVEGTPFELARDGRADEGAMRAEAISRRDLEEALRQSGVDDLAGARLVTLEPSGKITVLKSGR